MAWVELVFLTLFVASHCLRWYFGVLCFEQCLLKRSGFLLLFAFLHYTFLFIFLHFFRLASKQGVGEILTRIWLESFSCVQGFFHNLIKTL